MAKSKHPFFGLKIAYLDFFRNYKKNKAEAELLIVDWATRNGAIDYSKEAVKSSRNNGKEAQLAGLLDKERVLIVKCRVVEQTFSFFSEKTDERAIILNLIEGKTNRFFYKNFGKSKATFYKKLKKIEDTAQLFYEKFFIDKFSG